MTYYLYRKEDNFILPLGEVSFNKFYTEDGWRILDVMIDNRDQVLNTFVVRCSDSTTDISLEDFLKIIEKFEIILDKL